MSWLDVAFRPFLRKRGGAVDETVEQEGNDDGEAIVAQGAPNAGGAQAWPVDDGHPDPQLDALTAAELAIAGLATADKQDAQIESAGSTGDADSADTHTGILKKIRNILAGVLNGASDKLRTETTYSELVSRMFNTVAAPGYIIQPSVVNTDYLYIMEAPAGATPTTVGLRGIRVKLTNGSPDFGTQYNLGDTCTMSNYTTDGGWTA